MTKREFLDELRKKLNVLDKAEIDELLDEYSGYIDNKISEGESEEKAVDDFGDVDDLAREILSAYKINEDYVSGPRKKSVDPMIQQIVEAISSFVEQMIRFLASFFEGMSAEGAAKIIVTLAICLIVLFFMRIPFWIIEGMGNAILSLVLPHFLEGLFHFAWSLVCNIGYLIFAVVMIVDMVKKKRIVISPTGSRKNRKAVLFADSTSAEESGETDDEDDPPLYRDFDDEEFEYEPENDPDWNKRFAADDKPAEKSAQPGLISRILLVLIQFMLALFLAPFALGMIVLCVAVGLLVFLAVGGAHVWGIALVFAGLAGLIDALIDVVWSLTKPQKKLKKSFTQALVCAAVLGFGTLTFLSEYSNYTLKPFPLEELNMPLITQSATYRLSEDTDLIFNTGQVVLTADDALADGEVTILVETPESMQVHLNSQNGRIVLNQTADSNEIDALQPIQGYIKATLQGLKENVLYTYEGIPVQIEIRANPATLNKISRAGDGSYTYSL